jgi:hypothetical protein
MTCPVCKLELGIERREGELVLTWNVEDWRKHCTSRDLGSPTLCSNLLPTILKMLAKGKSFSAC